MNINQDRQETTIPVILHAQKTFQSVEIILMTNWQDSQHKVQQIF